MAARGKPVIAATGRSAMDASDRSGDLERGKEKDVNVDGGEVCRLNLLCFLLCFLSRWKIVKKKERRRRRRRRRRRNLEKEGSGVNAAKLVSKITVATAAMETIDMQDMLMKSTLDSMFKVGFGMELNALSGSYDLGQQFARAFDDANSITFRRFVDMTWKLKRIFNIGWEANLKQNMKVIDAFIYKLIERKREQMSNGETLLGKEDILSRFLLESEKDQENMTDKYLRDITLNFIIAGKDTTANSLTWFFYSLCKHPLVQEKVAQEVREAATANQNGEVTSAEEFVELLTQEALDKMHYLHAALTETLRLYPAVPLVMKHSSSEFSAIQGIGWIPVIKWRILVHLEGLSNFK
ncbi:unnamed protein product [Linum tenue]|uniref:Cytochrome P450 n=1 Tax=Linum tenue TaxID=586396 RepID=A0AAV0HTA7_9ROSI|nr:unnamed protein product [Linum tenue]